MLLTICIMTAVHLFISKIITEKGYRGGSRGTSDNCVGE